MSTIHAVALDRSSRVRGVRRLVEKYFYLWMSLVIGAVVVYGFSHSIISNGLLTRSIRPPRLLWIHGIVCGVWVVLFIVQCALVSLRQVKLHKLLGWLVAGLGAVMPVLGFAITRVMARFEVASLHVDPNVRAGFLAVPFLDMTGFTAAFCLALLLRKRPEYHRRLIFLAACLLTGPAFARFPLNVPYLAFYTGVDGLILLGMLRDCIVLRKVHAVYMWFLPPLVVLEIGAIYIMVHKPAWWIPIGRDFIG